MQFSELGLSKPVLRAVSEQGYTEATPIQAQAIPVIMQGRDLMAAAQTGTGKTAGFTLPILERLGAGRRAEPNQARCLILTPTRELAAQVEASVLAYSRHLPLRSAVVFGGVKINPQMMKLRQGVDILVATPGRLLDLYQQNAVRFDALEVLVLDEADRMLDMGFIHDIRKIISRLPAQRQTLMFSATFSTAIRKLAKSLVRDAIEVSASPPNSTVKSVRHWIHPVDKARKSALLVELIEQNGWHQVLVFSRTKHGANRLTKYLLARKIQAAAIHGNKSQGARTRALADFKAGKTQVLVATDIAARGLDIELLPHVINFDLPNVAEDYVHRIGRTGRAGARGEAVSLVSADEIQPLLDIEKLLGRKLERCLVDGFEPDHSLPETAPRKKGRQAGKGGKRMGKASHARQRKGASRQQARAARNQRQSGRRDARG